MLTCYKSMGRPLLLLLAVLLQTELCQAVRHFHLCGNSTSLRQDLCPDATKLPHQPSGLPLLMESVSHLQGIFGHHNQPFWIIVVGQLLGSIIRVRLSDSAHTGLNCAA